MYAGLGIGVEVGVRVGSNADGGRKNKHTGIQGRKDGEIRGHKKVEE